MPIASLRAVLVLAALLLADACADDPPDDPKVGTQRPDGGADAAVTGGAGSGAGSGAYAGGVGGSAGRAGRPAADGGRGGASGSAGKLGAAGSGGLSTTAGSGGTDLGAGCPKGLQGPALVNVQAPEDSAVSSYCVDATEVTNAHYATFLSASVATADQDEPCAWNTSYTPSRNWPVTGMDDYPVANVDWCDAFAYCQWAGKHLCGRIGGGESHFSFDYNNAAESEWFNACSAGATSTYSNGNEYKTTACVGIDYNEAGYQPATDLPRPVGTPTCVGGYDGLYDLSGNVWEWENSCRGPDLNEGCRMRGGASNSETAYLMCDSSSDRERNFTTASLGFRCCADADAP